MKQRWMVWLLILLILPPLSMAQPQNPDKVYRVAILPFAIHSEENLDYLRDGIYDILLSRITAEGKITVVDRSVVERALYEERPTRLDEPTTMKIGAKVGADYVVLGSITKIGNYISLDARMISVTEGKPPLTAFTQHKGLDDVMVKIGDFAQEIGLKILGRRPPPGRVADTRRTIIIRPQDEGIVDREGRGFRKSQTFNFEIKGLDIGDVDGDKKKELVIMDTSSLYIFKFDGDRLKLSLKIEDDYRSNFLTLDVADINRNGIDEIIVTSVFDDNLRSFIIEFEEGRFRKIAEDAPWYFRVLEHPKEGPVLMGQNMGSEGVFVGPIYKMVWKKKSFEKGPKMDFPPETILFGLALVPLPKQKESATLVLDQFDRLRIIGPNGKSVWSSKDHYGGSNNFYDTRKKFDPGHRAGEIPPWRTYIPGRILVRDLDGDGVSEVIINRNHSDVYNIFEKMKSFSKGEIFSLLWEENNFVTNWKTQEIEGYLSDFQVKDLDNDGEVELVVSAVNFGGALEKKVTSSVFFLKLF